MVEVTGHYQQKDEAVLSGYCSEHHPEDSTSRSPQNQHSYQHSYANIQICYFTMRLIYVNMRHKNV